MVGENFDFFFKLKDMQMRNVSFSEAGEDQFSEIGNNIRFLIIVIHQCLQSMLI